MELLAISIVEAARRSGLGRSTIYEAIARGELKVRKAGRRSLILIDDLQAWLARLPEAKPVAMQPASSARWQRTEQ
jgi:excisionase family DNA binding protein